MSRLNAALTRFFSSIRQGHSPGGDQHDPRPARLHPAELSEILGIHHFQAQGVLISTNTDPRDVTLDGEVRGQTPLYAHMAEERLYVMVPQAA